MAILVHQTEMLQTPQSTEQAIRSNLPYDQLQQSRFAEVKIAPGRHCLSHAKLSVSASVIGNEKLENIVIGPKNVSNELWL